MAEIARAELKIGMEVHMQLATRRKMFARVANGAHPDHDDAEPNALIDPIVAALPGTLPVMNRRAVEMSIMVGLALNCRIPGESEWDRKNYFYPDLPKGYQISQYADPLCTDGLVEVSREDGSMFRVGIIRAHLEEDAGKLGHELPGGHAYDGSLVDLNRAGTPLLEIVTQPDLTSADDAVAFARELRNIGRFLKVTEGDMQRGHIRFEPNINLIVETEEGRSFATPIVEIKNLNSFRSLRDAIVHESTRQIEEWKRTGETHGEGMKTTRGWDQQRERTFLQRGKEDAHDYRYFPDPDLPRVFVNEEWLNEIRAQVPKLPADRRMMYTEQFGLSVREAWALTSEREVCEFFERVLDAGESYPSLSGDQPNLARQAAKWVLNAGARVANERECEVNKLGITPEQLAQLIEMREQNEIGSNAAESLFELMCDPQIDGEPRAIAEREGLLQVRDDAQLEAWVEAAISAEPDSADDFAQGKDAAVGRLVGAIMRESGGKADAKAAREAIRKRLRG
ncbi:MAG: Asp-tRNA(Asn)/Glu-tRNA(Gln) amidotransferase subunit GatB [Phycisphaerales bacterium]|nr:MAG: Asp-tRNA(Asn)/Glu-tRNA(Gln) amidotransferase subunit GatB [Phycisphaerales bacterium]